MKILELTCCILLLIAPAFLGIAMTGCAASQVDRTLSKELVTLEPRSGVTQNIMLLTPDSPVAAVILLEGGPGKIGIGGSESNPSVKVDQGFLVRNRDNFARHGLKVALVDAASDVPSRGMNPSFRMSSHHAEELEHVISYLRQRDDLPVWLVGVSMGSFSAANTAIQAKDDIQGLVLVSALTRGRSIGALAQSAPNGILDMDLDEIVVPTLLVAHRDDECPDTPASGVPEIQARLTNAPEVSVQYFTGGEKSPTSNPCRARTPHTFYGIDEDVVAVIADFIKLHSQ